MKKKRVVVTGMGVVSPNATGLDNFEKALPYMKKYLNKIGDYQRRDHKLDEDFIRMVDKVMGQPADILT